VVRELPSTAGATVRGWTGTKSVERPGRRCRRIRPRPRARARSDVAADSAEWDCGPRDRSFNVAGQKLMEVHRSLKRTLNRALARQGAMFVALLPTSPVVNAARGGGRLGNAVLPASIGSEHQRLDQADQAAVDWGVVRVAPVGGRGPARRATTHVETVMLREGPILSCRRRPGRGPLGLGSAEPRRGASIFLAALGQAIQLVNVP